MRSRPPIKFSLKTLIKSPDLAYTLIRMALRKHITTYLDYKYGNGKSFKMPYQISLRITNVCNHRCAVCGQYGKHGYMNKGKTNDFLKVLPIEKYKNLVDEVSNYKPLFYITGGEPFLYPGLVELMNYIKKKGCIATIVTNGVLLEKYAEEIVKNKWDMIMVSVDGPKEIHDKCRNVDGAYDTCINGLLKLDKMKKKYKSIKPFVFTSTTISKVNASVLNETLNMGNKINPDLMIIYLSWFTSENIGKAQEKILRENLNINPFTWKSYSTKFNENDAEIFEKAINSVKEKKYSFPYFIIPDVKDIKKYYLDPSETFGYTKCVAPFIMVDIMPNGDVTTCRDFVDVKVGNINEKPLFEIWNDKNFINFRKLLIKNKGLLPQCSRCCGLMGF